jgi:predicted transcriptional regulator
MEANEQQESELSKQPSLAELLDVSSTAVTLYFELAAEPNSYPKAEIQENHGLSEKKVDKYLAELQTCGLVRRNPDETYEAVAPIEAVMIALTRVRDLLRQLKTDFPERIETGIPEIDASVKKEVEILPYQLETLRTKIDQSLDSAFEGFRGKAHTLQSTPTFEAFAEALQTQLLDEVDERIMETRNQLNDFETIDAFINVLNKLKTDVFDIVNISLSDMREQSFRLHELDDFRETLIELWNVTPSVVEEHLAEFEQEMSALEASLGDLMETKYRLGAFKGVIENFARDHIMTAVKRLKSNFQVSLTEAIQDHLKEAQERFEEVAKAAHQEFDKLREQLAEWVHNALDLAFSEVIQRNQKATTELADRLAVLTQTFQEKFASGLEDSVKKVRLQARELDTQLAQVPDILDQLRNQEFTPQLDQMVAQSERHLTKITHDIPKAFEEWRIDYIRATNTQISSLLQEAEGHVSLATRSVNQFWRRSKESETTTFDLYQFVVGEKEFHSYMASQIARARSQLFIILPRAIKVKVKLLKMIPSNVLVRLVVADTPATKMVQSIQRLAEKNSNFQIRHDPRGDLWGVIHDSEEILLGNTSKGTGNVVGIASSHEDHVDLLRSIMETRWLHARSLSSK